MVSSSKKPSQPSQPSTINGIDKSKLKPATVVIKDKNGNVTTSKPGEYKQYGDAIYRVSDGKIMGDTHGIDGVMDKNQWNKDWVRDKNGNSVGIWTEKPDEPKKKPSRPSGGSSESGGSSDNKPSRPPYIEFTQPFPTFSSDVKEITKYFYFFGLDKIHLSSTHYTNTSVFVSPIIDLGELYEKDYIMLEATYLTGDSGCIEFYIIDENNEVPILPYDVDYIVNEKIFKGMGLRFKRDESKPYVLKKGQNIVQTLLGDIINNNNLSAHDLYTVDYYPLNSWIYKPTQRFIQIKAILRNFGEQNTMPYLQDMSLRKYTEGAPWTQREV